MMYLDAKPSTTHLKLKELEDTILGAEDRLYNLEYELFCQVREEIYKKISLIFFMFRFV